MQKRTDPRRRRREISLSAREASVAKDMGSWMVVDQLRGFVSGSLASFVVVLGPIYCTTYQDVAVTYL